MIKRGQGSLEYLIIIAAVLVVAGVVVMFVAGSAGAGKQSVMYSTCQEAAVKCNAQRLANPLNPCNFCEAACSDPSSGEEIFYGAEACCRKGEHTMIYEGSEGCAEPPECREDDECTEYADFPCIDNKCVDNECSYDAKPEGSVCPGGLCNDVGVCVSQCVSAADCPAGDDCNYYVCEFDSVQGKNVCNKIIKEGESCSGGAGYCSASGECVLYACVDDAGCGDTGNECTVFKCESNTCVIHTADGEDGPFLHENVYFDGDGDGYGAGDSLNYCSASETLPAGYSTVGTDCDDGNPDIWESRTLCEDIDGDTYGTTSGTVTGCYGDSSTYPSGFVKSCSDCNDADNTIWRLGNFYEDKDGDGRGTGSLIYDICYGSSTPSGYSTNKNDCDDNDGTIWRLEEVRTDNDNDGYGVGTAFDLCVGDDIPLGYCNAAYTQCYYYTDCDDDNAAVHPEATEICDNGIDDNCDGVIDCSGFVAITLNSGSGYVYSAPSWTSPPNFSIIISTYSSANQYYGIDFFGDRGLVGGTNGYSMYTKDGGATWTGITTGSTKTIYDIDWCGDLGGSNTAFGAGADGFFESFNTFGESWTTFASQPTTNTLNRVSCLKYMSSSYVAWAVGFSGTIVRFVTGTGTVLTSGTTNTLYGVDFVDLNTGWAVGNSGTILKTTNGGDSWSPQSSGTTQNLRAVDFTDTTHGWVALENGGVLKTTNGGTSWTAVTSPVSGGSSFLSDIQFANATHGWVTGRDSGNYGIVCMTQNSGSSWGCDNSIGYGKTAMSIDFLKAA